MQPKGENHELRRIRGERRQGKAISSAKSGTDELRHQANTSGSLQAGAAGNGRSVRGENSEGNAGVSGQVATGQEHTVPRSQIVAMQTLPTSLMPNGLDRTLSEQELLDLVAFLRSRK